MNNYKELIDKQLNILDRVTDEVHGGLLAIFKEARGIEKLLEMQRYLFDIEDRDSIELISSHVMLDKAGISLDIILETNYFNSFFFFKLGEGKFVNPFGIIEAYIAWDCEGFTSETAREAEKRVPKYIRERISEDNIINKSEANEVVSLEMLRVLEGANFRDMTLYQFLEFDLDSLLLLMEDHRGILGSVEKFYKGDD